MVTFITLIVKVIKVIISLTKIDFLDDLVAGLEGYLEGSEDEEVTE